KNIDLNPSWNAQEQEAYLRRQIEEMKSQYEPIIVDYPGINLKNYIYYKNSKVLTQLKYYPYIQLVAISVFILISYLAFSYSRRSEQDKVWVGMSKETAHQLGTPLSGLMAWTEILKSDERLKDDTIIYEIEKDINRLATITERFSNIGSLPSYKNENIADLITQTTNYLRDRVGRNVEFQIINNVEGRELQLNRALFEWVIENITKNAIDAMSGRGKLTITLGAQGQNTYIDIADTGKGIPKNHFEKVFQPGFTTKQRGWGLGLTLVKRIVEEYHNGKIVVRSSEIGKGTTFRIMLYA
ncbi:MAG TPA: HAMP domain-containing sensor histidine kinase, partial [Cytophagales bacterium]|nr:HAMP domain-containing sensor histidine kinase [Cytophagales bacterium]